MTEEERAKLIVTIRQAMIKLRSNLALPVASCIRQLALGAVLCSANLGEALCNFRDEADLLLSKFQK